MKLDQRVFEVTSTLDVDAEEQEMTIHSDSLQHIMDILTRLYPNPVKAVLREYSTNAFDSHIQARQTRPIEVKLPTELNPTLSIRDFGVGLSKNEILYQYSAYGFSTKRESNEQTGALGLGCKSALCVTTQFNLRSIKDGKITVALIGRNDKGSGTFKIVHEGFTEEDNGVTVSIPVPTSDIKKYHREAMEFFCLIEPERYRIVNTDLDPTSFVAPKEKVSSNERVQEALSSIDEHLRIYEIKKAGVFQALGHKQTLGANIGTAYVQTKIMIRMGDVVYPLKRELFKDSLFSTFFSNYGLLIVLKANLGDLSIAPQREELLYDRKTEEWVKEKISIVEQNYTSSIQTAISAAKSGKEAIDILSSFYSSREYRDFIRTGFQFEYNGYVIPAEIGIPKPASSDNATIGYWKNSTDQTRHIFYPDDSRTYNSTSGYQIFKNMKDKKKRADSILRFHTSPGSIDVLSSAKTELIIIEDFTEELTTTNRKKLAHFTESKLDVDISSTFILLTDSDLTFEKVWIDKVFNWKDVLENWKKRPRDKKQAAEKKVAETNLRVWSVSGNGNLKGFKHFTEKDTTVSDMSIEDIKNLKGIKLLSFIPANKQKLLRVRTSLTYENLVILTNAYHPGDEKVHVIVAPRNQWRTFLKISDRFTTLDEYSKEHFQNFIDTSYSRKYLLSASRYGWSERSKFRLYNMLAHLGISKDEVSNTAVKHMMKELEEILGIKNDNKEEIPREINYMDDRANSYFMDLERHGIIPSVKLIPPSRNDNSDPTKKSKLDRLATTDLELLQGNNILKTLATFMGHSYNTENTLKQTDISLADLKRDVLHTINELKDKT